MGHEAVGQNGKRREAQMTVKEIRAALNSVEGGLGDNVISQIGDEELAEFENGEVEDGPDAILRFGWWDSSKEGQSYWLRKYKLVVKHFEIRN